LIIFHPVYPVHLVNFVFSVSFVFSVVASMNLQERTEKHLRAIEKRGQWRTLQPPRFGSVDLCSNDYLGLANDPRVRAAMIAEIDKNGCGSTASRLLRGEREVFAAVERRFSEFKNTERALFFGSGYAANIGLLTAFLETGDVVFSDELNHASLIDGIRLAKAERVVFPHNDAASLEKLLAATPCQGQRFVVVESLYSMDGDFAPLHHIVEVCSKWDAALIVDEAHAVGVFGENGAGLIGDNHNDVFLSINTAGKALGVGGAFSFNARARSSSPPPRRPQWLLP
jgi:7-keto-8-aminopelargonate synthetase-like enzyme